MYLKNINVDRNYFFVQAFFFIFIFRSFNSIFSKNSLKNEYAVTKKRTLKFYYKNFLHLLFIYLFKDFCIILKSIFIKRNFEIGFFFFSVREIFFLERKKKYLI